MKGRIVKIGNSKGIRIPKALIEECGLHGDVQMEVLPDGLLIKPSKTPRLNWDKAFAQMFENDDDELIIDEPEESTNFAKEKWRW